jgi:hypothetical protein
MKGDFTRRTFDRARHYRSVELTQGLVHLDAYWNEQQDITRARIETETVDTIGEVGAPILGGGFRVEIDKAKLDPSELAEGQTAPTLAGLDFYLTRGRIYVEGMLVESERLVTFESQPDGIDAASAIPGAPGLYLVYLRAYPHYVTTLDQAAGEVPALRDPAIGEADAAGRVETVWRAGLLPVPDGTACGADLALWDALTRPKLGRMSARSVPPDKPEDPCVVPPTAGYRRLHNQLYRVEVSKPGPPGTAELVWSRDNAAYAAAWTGVDAAAKAVLIDAPPKGPGRGFANGDLAELTTRAQERRRTPGSFRTVDKAERDRLLFAAAPPALPPAAGLPRVRQWNGGPVVIPADGSPVPLEDGVVVAFSTDGEFRAGDYWLVPARTRTADVEWPRATDGTTPLLLPPHGVEDRWARLALLRRNAGGWIEVSDCRPPFAPLTDLLSFHYLGGDGQEATPDPLAAPPQPLPLADKLRVGVAWGTRPVAGARVRFTVTAGTGTLQPASPVVTDAAGIAEAAWSLDPATPIQGVVAELLRPDGTVRGQPIRFAARLRRAAEVSYDPAACANLTAAGVRTVQQAIDALCKLPSGGGGCCVTIGPEGEYPTLDQAINDLRERGERDLCLCLRAGEHKLLAPLGTQAKDLRIAIHGCGAAVSRLRLDARSLIAASAIAIERLGLEMLADGAGLDLKAERIELADLVIEGPSQGNKVSLLRLDAERSLRLVASRVTAMAPESLEAVRGILEPLSAPLAGALKPAAAPQLRLRTDEATQAMQALSASQRRTLTNRLATLSQQGPLAPVERAAIGRLGQAIAAGGAGVAAALDGVRTAAAEARPGPAVAIASMLADTRIEGNDIRGVIALRGEAHRTPLGQVNWEALLARSRTGPPLVASGGATLHLCHNRLAAFTVDERLLVDLQKLALEGGPVLPGVFDTAEVQGNVLTAAPVILLAEKHLFGHNRLDMSEDAGALVGRTATCLGNQADNDFRLWVATQAIVPSDSALRFSLNAQLNLAH